MRPTALMLVAVLVAPALGGCVGSDPTGSSTGTVDGSAPDANGQATSDASANSSNRSGTAPSEPTEPALGSRLIWLDATGTLLQVGADGSVEPVPLQQGPLDDAFVSAIRWDPDGALYATLLDPGAIVRIEPGAGMVEFVTEGEPIASPVALAVVDDRLLVADAGTVDPGGDAMPGKRTPRLIEVDPSSGQTRVLPQGSDTRFAAADGSLAWFGLVASHGTAYLATSHTDPRVATPTDRSDDEGEGAIWRVDPASGAHELIAAGGALSIPDGLAVLPNGSLVVSEWVSEKPEVHLVDPEEGTVRTLTSLDEAGFLWGGELLPDGRVVVTAACGDPLGVGDDDGCGPGGLWAIDPATGEAAAVASDPSVDAPGQARVWPLAS